MWREICIIGLALVPVAAKTSKHDKYKAPPLSERLRRVTVFEEELQRLSKGKPGKVNLDYEVNTEPIVKEAQALIEEHGETLEYHHLKDAVAGQPRGHWTTLGLMANNGDMCDDRSTRRWDAKGYGQTTLWDKAPAIRELLTPIEPALKRVRFSIMHPATMVNWHCDDCPGHDKMAPPGCKGHVDPSLVHKSWRGQFHRWVRLHLMLTTTDIQFAIGGTQQKSTTNGNFYLANVAMPHRVDNKGDSKRIALLVDVVIKGREKVLQQSALGRSILKAVGGLQSPDYPETYLKMGEAMFRYRCGDQCTTSDRCLTVAERYETEFHRQMWSKPLWRPLPPFETAMFNSPGRCGTLGPPENKHKLEMSLSEGSAKAARRRRRSSSQ